MVKAEFPEVEVIAGTATAGIPHGAIIADYLQLPLPISVVNPKIMVQEIKSKVVSLKGKNGIG